LIRNDELVSKTIAYDGLLVFVPFTSAERLGGLAAPLGGKIKLDQLRRLYIGEIANWQELNGPNLPVRLFVPTESTAIKIFEQVVLGDEQAIQKFRSLRQEGKIEQLETIRALRTIYQDFEYKRSGGIGFGIVSQVFQQCTVYPLALVKGREQPVQALVRNDGKPIDPKTNLCNKGSYRLNETMFQNQQYSLAFSLNVLYPNDNREGKKYQIGRKFAEILTTEQGQCLLGETNLIPLQPLNSCSEY
jgi:ABC-type phosphate transport system substrate-binding protein